MGNEKRLSTTAIAKQVSMSTKEMFSLLAGYAWIEKKDDSWELTELGKEIGGEYVTHPKYGKYIAWPDSIVSQMGFDGDGEQEGEAGDVLSATALGRKLGMSAQRVNHIFSEIGWIEKALKGWRLTEQGVNVGGIQKEHPKSGVPYVNWPESIVENKSFSILIRELEEGSTSEEDAHTGNEEGRGFNSLMQRVVQFRTLPDSAFCIQGIFLDGY